ncbi:Tetratricopeptide repeat protein 4 [Balamuthia mandrillaris]
MQGGSSEMVEDWESPLFMTAVPSEDHPEADTIAALQHLIYEDETPETIAENYKQQGNEVLKQGAKFYRDAIKCYTMALEQNSPNQKNNSIYYSNRAHVHLLLRNYGHALEDSENAIKLDESNVKAYYRGARACLATGRLDLGFKLCADGLTKDPENAGLKQIQENLQKEFNKKEEQAKAECVVGEEKQRKKRELQAALSQRGIKMGQAAFASQGGQFAVGAEDALGKPGTRPWLDDKEGTLHWPVLFLYPQHQQSDMIQDFNENDRFVDHLQVMFPERRCCAWDVNGEYVWDELCVYFETNWTTPLGQPVDSVNYARRQKVKLDPSLTLQEALAHKDYLVPGFPVFHVVPPAFESEFLNMELA